MAVTLPATISGTVTYEYAAVGINFNRQIINVNGSMVPSYSCSIAYMKMGYLIDSTGNKIATVSSGTPGSMTPPDPNETGNIYLDATKIGTIFSQMPAANTALGDVIANLADSLIHADLVSRGILTV